MRTCLILLQPLLRGTTTRIDVRVGDAPSADGYGTIGQIWEPAIARRPSLSIELMSPDLDGRVQVGKASFDLALRSIRRVVDPAMLVWRGAPVTILTEDAQADLGTVPEFSGVVTGARLNLETLVLSIDAEVVSRVLDRPLLISEFTGGGGVTGDAAKRGTLKPAGFGTVKNIEPIWFDETNNIGMIDGYANTVSIDWLGEGRSSFGARVADYANYAALAAAIVAHTIPPGRWGSCVAEGLVGLGAPPNGIITVDAVFGTNRPGAMMRRWLETHGGISTGLIDTGAFSSLDTTVNRPVHHWTSTQVTIRALLEEMAASCNATPLITFQNKITVTRGLGGTSAGTLDRSGSVVPRPLDWRVADTDSPFYKLKARAARPATILSRDQVNYVDQLVDRGLYLSTTVYRAGNIAYLSDGSSWLYINATPAAGNYPAAGAYWQALTPSTVVDFASVIGSTRPADYATKDLTLISIGTSAVTVQGNKLTGGTDDFNSCALGPALPVTAYAEVDVVVGSRYTIISLDDDSTTTTSSQSVQVQFQQSTGSLGVYRNGTAIATTTFTGATAQHKLAVAYDGVRYRVFLANQEYFTGYVGMAASGPSLRHFPKWHLYDSGTVYLGCRVAPYTENVWASLGGVGLPESNADVTLTAQVIVDLAVNQKSVNADYLGNVNTGALPVTFSPSVKKNAVSVKLDNVATYAITKPSDGSAGADGGTASVDNTNGSSTKGDVSVSAFDSGSIKIKFRLTVTYAGVTVGVFDCIVDKVNASPPGGGSGGGSSKFATVPANAATSSISYVPVSSASNPTLVIASGEKLYASMTASYAAGSGVGGRSGTFKHRYSTDNATWTDFGSAVTGNTASPGRTIDFEYIDPVDGSVTINQNVAGLSAGTYYVQTVFLSSSSTRTIVMNGESIVYEAKP